MRGDHREFSPAQLDVLYTVGRTFQALSFVGSFLVIVTFWRFHELRSAAFSFVFFLAVSDFCSGIAYFLAWDPPTGSVICSFQGIFVQFFTFATCVWTGIIAHFLNASIFKDDGLQSLSTLRKKYHCVCWISSLAVTLPPAVGSLFENAGVGFCWIGIERSPRMGNFLRLVCFYGPMWILIYYNLRVYLKVTHFSRTTLKVHGSDEAIKPLLRSVRRLKYYPITLVVCYFWATVNRIHNMMVPDSPIFWLYLLQIQDAWASVILNSTWYLALEKRWNADMELLDQDLELLGQGIENRDRSGSSDKEVPERRNGRQREAFGGKSDSCKGSAIEDVDLAEPCSAVATT